MATAGILTIGNELVSGDVSNTNGSWIAKRLAPLGVETRLLAAIPDEIDTIAEFVRREAPRVDFLIVTGGLGGTPDDPTREAPAAALHAPPGGRAGRPDARSAGRSLRCAAGGAARHRRRPALPLHPRAGVRGALGDAAARLAPAREPPPRGARPLANPLGGAPGFAIENVYVLPGLPSEMEAMFDSVAEEFRRGSPIGAWRRTYRTRESVIAPALVQAGERWPAVLIGSYPAFGPDGSTVEVVVKSSEPDALREASSWLESALEERG